MTMTTGQSAAPSVGNVQPQQQKKEKHLVHWFRKGQSFKYGIYIF